MNNNNNDSNNNEEHLVQQWGRLLVRTLVPDLVPQDYQTCNNNFCKETQIIEEKIKKKIPKRNESEEVFKKVTVGRQYLCKELIPVAGSSLSHPEAARSDKILAAAVKIAKKISKEDIERLTSGQNSDVFAVSVNKRAFYASIMKQEAPLKVSSNLLHCSQIIVFSHNGTQQEVVSTSHTYWNENIEKIICMVPVLKLPIRLPYVITNNGRFFQMKLDELNLERFCQARSDEIALV